VVTAQNRRFDPRCPKNTSRRRRIFGWRSACRSAQAQGCPVTGTKKAQPLLGVELFHVDRTRTGRFDK